MDEAPADQLADDGTSTGEVPVGALRGWALRALGRPFLVGDVQRVTMPAVRTDWNREVDVIVAPLGNGERRRLSYEWAAIAAVAHASIAALARSNLQLLALGASATLVRTTQQAMTDKVEHALLAYSIAAAYGGQALGPGALNVAGSVGAGDVWVFLVNTLREGCIGEMTAALAAVEGLASVRDPAIVAALGRLSRDQQKHCELAWRIVRWLLGAQTELGADLRRVVEEEIGTCRTMLARIVPDPAADWLLRHGLLCDHRRSALRLQVLVDVITPSLHSLCASHAAA